MKKYIKVPRGCVQIMFLGDKCSSFCGQFTPQKCLLFDEQIEDKQRCKECLEKGK